MPSSLVRAITGWWQPTGSPSDRELHPDFVSDTFSAFYLMAAASRVIRGLYLEDYGLRWRHAPAVLGHPRPNGPWDYRPGRRGNGSCCLRQPFC
jgi:hypothetical protein